MSLYDRVYEHFKREHPRGFDHAAFARLATKLLAPELERREHEANTARQHAHALETSLAEQEAWSGRLERRLAQSSDRVQQLIFELDKDPTHRVGRCGEPAPALVSGGEPAEPPAHCSLPAHHAGWHRDDFGREWNTPAPPRTRDMTCPHCPDGHTPPTGGSQPWGAFVGPERDSDGQPTTIYVMRSAGAHVADSDAEWVHQVLNQEAQR